MRMIYQLTRTILTALSILVATSLWAQQDMTVSLVDQETRKPVPDISVSLKNVSRNLLVQQTTNQQGKTTFRNLPTLNGYEVVFEGNDAFLAKSVENISIKSNQSPDVTLVLTKNKISDQTLSEVVVPYNSTAKINRRDAEVSFELKAEEIQEIPVEARDITRVLYRLPNVTQATGFYPEAPNVSINGSNSLYTSYLIDGLDNNERFLGGQKFNIPSGFVKDLTVLTSNFSAEYGLTGSGVVDVTPRSGSNTTHGEVFFISRPGPAIDAPSSFVLRDLSGNQVKDGFARFQGGVGIGGALKQDKTFYYLNLEHTTDIKDNLLNVPDLNVVETVRGRNEFNYLSTKIDHLWNSNVRTSLRANVGIVGIERQGGGLDGGVTFPSAGNTQQRNSALVALNNAYNFGKISGETNLQYARFRWDYARPENLDDPQVTVRNPDGQTIAILGHPGYIFNALENTVQVQQKFKYYLENHVLKAGVNYIRGEHELLGGGNPNGNYTVQLTPEQLAGLRNRGSALGVRDLPSDVQVLNYNVELRPAAFGTHQDIYSVYVEDLWSATEKLNLTIGLRYDYDNLSKGGSDKGDYNNLAPRLNANYALTPRSSLRAGYGIAYDKINYGLYSDALQQNTTSADYRKQLQQLINLGILPANTNLDAITFDGNIGASVSNVAYLQGPPASALQEQREGAFSNERRILNPNGYKNPLSHQFSIGYQQQVDETKLFFVDVVYNRNQNLFRLRNLNAAAEYRTTDPDNVVVRTQAQADASRPIPIVNGSAVINGETVTGVARNVIVSESEGKAEYYALSLNYQKVRGRDDRYSFRVNYTLSSLKNDTEDINFRAMDANNYAAEWGPSINDRTHNLNGIFNYYPWKRTTITLASLLQSGQPINRIPMGFGTTDLNGDGSGFGDAYVGNSDRFPGESRNSDRLPWSTNFDLGVQQRFRLHEATQLELRADVFNVFNAENLSGYSNNATQSNQIQGGSSASGLFVQRNAGAPRQFQFSLRLLF